MRWASGGLISRTFDSFEVSIYAELKGGQMAGQGAKPSKQRVSTCVRKEQRAPAPHKGGV